MYLKIDEQRKKKTKHHTNIPFFPIFLSPSHPLPWKKATIIPHPSSLFFFLLLDRTSSPQPTEHISILNVWWMSDTAAIVTLQSILHRQIRTCVHADAYTQLTAILMVRRSELVWFIRRWALRKTLSALDKREGGKGEGGERDKKGAHEIMLGKGGRQS